MKKHLLSAVLLSFFTSASFSFAATCPTLTKTLAYGSKDTGTSTQVKQLQTFLAERFSVDSTVLVTGTFGYTTQKYVRLFQKEVGLPQSGAVASRTRAAIATACRATTGSAGGTPSYSATDAAYTFTLAQLEKIAGDDFASGVVPLGDNKYSTTTPQKGIIYLCNVPRGGVGGAQAAGPWIHSALGTWNFKQKIAVSGDVSWPNATFTNTLASTTRTLSGNGLPTSHTTGTFPVSRTDSAYQYDRNPNTISAQSIRASLPGNPTYSSTPNCMGMEVGILNTGVALFNGFDATMRDAGAHEVQDTCEGHPERTGHYHYHSMSSCLPKNTVKDIVGYAYDGHPITGPYVTESTYLTTADLDVCHGITSPIYENGKFVTKYHYVLTHDFPYSVSCFRGKATQTQALPNASPQSQHNTMGEMAPQQSGTPPTPPQEAIAACTGKTNGNTCSFSAPHGTISGTCVTPPGLSVVACKP